MFLRLVGTVKVHFTLDGKDVAIVLTLGNVVVVDSFYNHR